MNTAVESLSPRLNNLDSFFAAIDGASRGNPGPAGIGLVLSDPGGTILVSEGRFIGHRTNNQAEYAALIFALEKSLELKIQNLKVQTDSQLLFCQLNGRYRILNPKLKPLFQQARELIQQLRSFEIVLVNREKNREADKAAKRALTVAANKALAGAAKKRPTPAVRKPITALGAKKQLKFV